MRRHKTERHSSLPSGQDWDNTENWNQLCKVNYSEEKPSWFQVCNTVSDLCKDTEALGQAAMLVPIKERVGQSKPSQIVCSDLGTLGSVEKSTRRSTSQNQWTPGTLIPTPRPRQRISLSQVSSPKGSSLNTNTGCGYKFNESTVLAVGKKKKKRMLAYFTQHLLTRGPIFIFESKCVFIYVSVYHPLLMTWNYLQGRMWQFSESHTRILL